MPFIDDHGRLFGRLNLVDAAVLLVVALLIPMAYGAYLIFQPPPARIVALEPARIETGATEVTLRGEHLRPYLRVVFVARSLAGNHVTAKAATFLYADTEGGVLRLPVIEPGVYDVVLLDEAIEIARVRDGLVVDVEAPALSPPIMVDVVLRNSMWPEELALLNSWNREGGSDGSLISADVVEKSPNGQLLTTVRMRIPVVETGQGWVYRGDVIWRGDTFVIERPSHRLTGLVVGIEPVASVPTPAR